MGGQRVTLVPEKAGCCWSALPRLGTLGPPLLHPQRDPMRENNKRSLPINPPSTTSIQSLSAAAAGIVQGPQTCPPVPQPSYRKWGDRERNE